MVRYHWRCKNSLLFLKRKFLLRVGDENFVILYWIHISFYFIYLHCYISIFILLNGQRGASSFDGCTYWWRLLRGFLILVGLCIMPLLVHMFQGVIWTLTHCHISNDGSAGIYTTRFLSTNQFLLLDDLSKISSLLTLLLPLIMLVKLTSGTSVIV